MPFTWRYAFKKHIIKYDRGGDDIVNVMQCDTKDEAKLVTEKLNIAFQNGVSIGLEAAKKGEQHE